MRRRTDHAPGLDDDGLQADVMRFMAIIAFCLVAIMALARNNVPLAAEATPTEAPVLAVVAEAAPTGAEPPEPRPVPVPVRTSVPAEPAPRVPEPAAETVPEPPEPVPEVVPEVVPELVPGLVPELFSGASPGAEPVSVPPAMPDPDPRVAPDVEGAIDPSPEPVRAPTRTAAPEASQEASTEEGLSLRFASDGDFLRLISRDAIDVFAFREGEVLTLAAGLRFVPAPAPGQVYELMPSTIPAPVGDALAETRMDPDSFTWGVRMPARMERSVRTHVDAGASGVLVIDRYGEVRLLAGEDRETL